MNICQATRNISTWNYFILVFSSTSLIFSFPIFLLTCYLPQQGLIGQYAVPILEEKSVWGTDAPTRIAYMDTQVITNIVLHLFEWKRCLSMRLVFLQDIARLTLIALRNEKVNGKLLTFAGPRAWTTQEVKLNIF